MVLAQVNIFGNRHFLSHALQFLKAYVKLSFSQKNFQLKSEILLMFSKLFHHGTLKVVIGIDDSYNNLLVSSNSVSEPSSILSDRDI